MTAYQAQLADAGLALWEAFGEEKPDGVVSVRLGHDEPEIHLKSPLFQRLLFGKVKIYRRSTRAGNIEYRAERFGVKWCAFDWQDRPLPGPEWELFDPWSEAHLDGDLARLLKEGTDGTEGKKDDRGAIHRVR